MREIMAEFVIRRCRFIDPEGHCSGTLPEFARDPRALVPLYRHMVLTRTFDTKAIALQRTGRLGTYASSLGQEAVALGVASAMRPEDVLVPSYREQAAQLWRGVTMPELLLYWGGDERGSDFGGPREDFPVSVPVGSHAPHAAGVAMALKLRREARVAVCFLGDGATSKGDVAEALNMAGVWQLPVVFVVSNNGWAISVPLRRQTAATSLAQKAIAAGFLGEQVDGNDVVAVRHVAGQAIEKARGGGGPRLIEALTYRLGDHTTADDATRYRDDAEVSRHWAEEPIARLRNHLSAQGAWTKTDEEQLLAQTARDVDAAIQAYLSTPAQPAASLFDSLYAELPAALAAQRAAVLNEATQAARTGESPR
jgi:pyruvate dehydrogenase E1 component alpha subunit